MSARAEMPRSEGFAMIEVLVTLVILLFGLLGLAGLQSRAQAVEIESYQRVQALVMVRDMVDRLNANRQLADCYDGIQVGAGYVGTPTCSVVPVPPVVGNLAQMQARAVADLADWDATLKGSVETSGGNSVGAMLGARGCVTKLTTVTGPPKYLIEVAWQGLGSTARAPSSLVCGNGSYGTDEALRREVSTVISFGTLSL